MKVVVNCCFGSFCLPDDFCRKYNFRRHQHIDRNDSRLVEYVENHPEQWYYNRNTKLKIVEIPEEATDWQIIGHEGSEDVCAVIDRKIVWL